MATMPDDEVAQVLRGVRAYFDDPNRIDGEDVRIVSSNVAPDGAADPSGYRAGDLPGVRRGVRRGGHLRLSRAARSLAKQSPIEIRGLTVRRGLEMLGPGPSAPSTPLRIRRKVF